MLFSPPVNGGPIILDSWLRLGPLLIKNFEDTAAIAGLEKPQFDKHKTVFSKRYVDNNGFFVGQFDRMNDQENGIIRKDFDGSLFEVYKVNGVHAGFFRVIWAHGGAYQYILTRDHQRVGEIWYDESG